jgi:hypothetical protein
MSKQLKLGAVAFGATLVLPACGAGVITSNDVSPGEGVVIGLIVIAAVLFVLAVGLRGK